MLKFIFQYWMTDYWKLFQSKLQTQWWHRKMPRSTSLFEQIELMLFESQTQQIQFVLDCDCCCCWFNRICSSNCRFGSIDSKSLTWWVHVLIIKCLEIESLNQDSVLLNGEFCVNWQVPRIHTNHLNKGMHSLSSTQDLRKVHIEWLIDWLMGGWVDRWMDGLKMTPVASNLLDRIQFWSWSWSISGSSEVSEMQLIFKWCQKHSSWSVFYDCSSKVPRYRTLCDMLCLHQCSILKVVMISRSPTLLLWWLCCQWNSPINVMIVIKSSICRSSDIPCVCSRQSPGFLVFDWSLFLLFNQQIHDEWMLDRNMILWSMI